MHTPATDHELYRLKSHTSVPVSVSVLVASHSSQTLDNTFNCCCSVSDCVYCLLDYLNNLNIPGWFCVKLFCRYSTYSLWLTKNFCDKNAYKWFGFRGYALVGLCSRTLLGAHVYSFPTLLNVIHYLDKVKKKIFIHTFSMLLMRCGSQAKLESIAANFR